MSDNPSGRLAWITGASSGIGRQLALKMAEEGWRVAISARSADKLEDLAQAHDRLYAYPLDVTDQAGVSAVCELIEEDLGAIDQAVFNAGTHKPDQAKGFRAAEVAKLIEINVMGTLYPFEVMSQKMIGRGEGRIAIVSSVAGYVGLPGASAYGLTKAGLINFAESMRCDLERHGVTLQLVNPGFVRTPLTDRNDFPMPFLMEVEEAVEAFYRGLQGKRFEIVFPWQMKLLMKVLRILPYALYLPITRKMLR